jgi:hypothetical protein
MIKPLSDTKITVIPVNLSAYYYNILVTKIEAFYSPTYVEKKKSEGNPSDLFFLILQIKLFIL